MEDLLKKIQEAKKICAQKKIDLETVDNRSLKESDALKHAIVFFYAFFDGYLPLFETYLQQQPPVGSERRYYHILEFIEKCAQGNIGEQEIEKFLVCVGDNYKNTLLWRPLLSENGADTKCGGSYMFGDVWGTIRYWYRTYKGTDII